MAMYIMNPHSEDSGNSADDVIDFSASNNDSVSCKFLKKQRVKQVMVARKH